MTTLHYNKKTELLDMPGVDWGGKMTLVARNDREGLLAARVEGSMAWSGIGMPRQYVPAQFVIFRYRKAEETKDGATFVDVADLGSLRFDVRPKKERA